MRGAEGSKDSHAESNGETDANETDGGEDVRIFMIFISTENAYLVNSMRFHFEGFRIQIHRKGNLPLTLRVLNANRCVTSKCSKLLPNAQLP